MGHICEVPEYKLSETEVGWGLPGPWSGEGDRMSVWDEEESWRGKVVMGSLKQDCASCQ
jgi:hypothetical protein